MRNEIERTKLFSRRCLFLAAAKLGLMGLLGSRLYYLQVIKSDEYRTLSDSNRIKLSIIPPARGRILDRFGQALADNRPYYRILYEADPSSDRELVITRLLRILENTPEEAAIIARRIMQAGRAPVLLQDDLSWDAVSKVELNIPDLPGVSIDEGAIRIYPYRNTVAHITGYVGSVSEKEMQKNNPLLSHPDFRIGKNGVERSFEHSLRGQAGVKRMEVNAYGLTVRELSREPSKTGKDLALTIDIRLQQFIHELAGKQNIATVVMDILTGDLLALYSSPAFDPNSFVQGISHAEWQGLLRDPGTPLVNKAVSSQYPPGSTFKMIVALAGLQEGMGSPDEVVNCPGHVDLGTQRFHCWRHEGHGPMNMQGALRESCDVYFYHLAQKIGIHPIAEMSRQFGFGTTTGIPLLGEAEGLVPTKEWKRRKYQKDWLVGDTLNASIGQGFWLSTPLQLAIMTARLASQKMIMPNLVLRSDQNVLPDWKDIPLQQSYFDIVLEGMREVVNHPQGTAYSSRIEDPTFAMAGKTGTAQVISRHRQRGGVWNEQHHALFVGYAPLYTPRYALALIAEHGGSGGQVAAPLGKEILLKAQQLGWGEGGSVAPSSSVL